MKHFFVYKYEWDDGWVYIGRSREGVNRFNNPDCYKSNGQLYEAMTTKKYRASIVFESDNIWDVGWMEQFLINIYEKTYNRNKELDWKKHIRTYIKQYKSKFEAMGWVIDDEPENCGPVSIINQLI